MRVPPRFCVLSLFSILLSACGEYKTSTQCNVGAYGGNGGSYSYALNLQYAAVAVVQKDCKLIVGGGAMDDRGNTHFVLQRFTSDGSGDATFGEAGTIKMKSGSAGMLRTIALQDDGKIIAAGTSVVDATVTNVAVRYNSDGSPDSSFGQGGKVTLHLDAKSNIPSNILTAPDGKVLIVISNPIIGGGTKSSFTIVRLNGDGTLDTSYAEQGKSVPALDQAFFVRNARLTTDGGLIVSGILYVVVNAAGDTTPKYGILGFDHTGKQDSSFGQNGVLIPDLGSSSFAVFDVVLKNSKLLVGGLDYRKGHSSFDLVRYGADGELDKVLADSTPIDSVIPSRPYVGGVTVAAVQSDEKAILGGFPVAAEGERQIRLVRLNADGTIDTNFGVSGTTAVGSDLPPSDLAALAVQPDGKIIAIGALPNKTVIVARFRSDGALDRLPQPQ
jgi:uncharacterized delta-60 repeat protein